MKQPDREKSNWSVVYDRVRLWDGRPQPGGLKSFFLVGGSDTGNIEYNGSILRFAGKKRQIDMPVIKSISEVAGNPTLSQILLYFIISLAGFELLAVATGGGPTGYLVALALALVGTAFSWWYFRRYGGWVWITFTSPEGQQKDVGFWAPPVAGSTQKLYQALIGLVTPQKTNE